MARQIKEPCTWLTTISNEDGEVVKSILAVDESERELRRMADDLTARYEANSWERPKVLYVDRDCCEVSGNSGGGKYNNLFHEWPNLQVRLDSMHYMARFSSLLTHPSHPLYAVFKRRLRDCIFTRDEGDVRSLLDSKKNELLSNGTRVESLPSQHSC